MAIFRQSPFVGALSGRLGGAIAAQTKQGQVLKHRPAKINRQTEASLAARAAFANLTRNWQQLTDAERREWNLFASNKPLVNRLGVSRLLTGFQWFMKGATFQWQQTANGIILYAGTVQVWEWDWSAETLTLNGAYDIDATQAFAGTGYGPISAPVWTTTQKTLSLNVDSATQAIIDLTASMFYVRDVDTTALASSTTTQLPAVAVAGYTYFQAWRASTAQLETYMAIDDDGIITLAGSLDIAS
jgi:hypothetical protein